MDLGRGLALCGIGLALGLPAAFALRRYLASLTFGGVSTADPLVLAAAAGLMIAASLAACNVPARSASRVDRMIALRHD